MHMSPGKSLQIQDGFIEKGRVRVVVPRQLHVGIHYTNWLILCQEDRMCEKIQSVTMMS